MPITKSAEKALRQSKKRRVANQKRAKDYKLTFKEFKKVADTKKNDAAKLLPKLYKALDKAAKTNVIKKNKASRLKSKAALLLK
jgi:small subunit ribosomal protein S20